MPKDDKLTNKMTISFSNESLTDLESCLVNYQLISKTLRELFGLISNAKMFLNNGKSRITTFVLGEKYIKNDYKHRYGRWIFSKKT